MNHRPWSVVRSEYYGEVPRWAYGGVGGDGTIWFYAPTRRDARRMLVKHRRYARLLRRLHRNGSKTWLYAPKALRRRT